MNHKKHNNSAMTPHKSQFGGKIWIKIIDFFNSFLKWIYHTIIKVNFSYCQISCSVFWSLMGNNCWNVPYSKSKLSLNRYLLLSTTCSDTTQPLWQTQVNPTLRDMTLNRENKLSACSHDSLDQEVQRELEAFLDTKTNCSAGELKLDFSNILNNFHGVL